MTALFSVKYKADPNFDDFPNLSKFWLQVPLVSQEPLDQVHQKAPRLKNFKIYYHLHNCRAYSSTLCNYVFNADPCITYK